MYLKPGPAVSIGFLLIWSALTLAGDGFMLSGIVRNARAQLTWPTAMGTITHSEVKAVYRKSLSYRLVVRYTYAVDGQPFEGARYSYSTEGSSHREHVEAMAQRFAVDTRVPVFHAPNAPAESLLDPSFQGGDLLVLLALLPFNLSMVWLAITLRRRLRRDYAVRPEQRDGRLRVSLNDVSPALAGAYGAGGTAFASIFLVGVPTGFSPSLPVAMAACVVAGVAGAGAVTWKRARLASGRYDLVLDPGARRLSLPAGFGREARLDVAWSEVQDITVKRHQRKESNGSIELRYRPTLLLTGGGSFQRREVLVDWGDPERAEALAAWLRAQLQPGEPGPAASLRSA